MEVGRVDTRLAHHDELIERLDATLAKVVDVQATLTLAVEALDAARIADEKTRIETAKVLKDTKEAQEGAARSEAAKAATLERTASARAALTWAPITKVFATGTFSFGFIAAVAIVSQFTR